MPHSNYFDAAADPTLHGARSAMPTKFGTPVYWRKRAEEARALAEDMNDAGAKRAMLIVAENYEKIARQAEAEEAGLTTPSPKSR
jgi:hypothetical protein